MAGLTGLAGRGRGRVAAAAGLLRGPFSRRRCHSSSRFTLRFMDSIHQASTKDVRLLLRGNALMHGGRTVNTDRTNTRDALDPMMAAVSCTRA